MNDETREDLHDRVVEKAIEEKVGGLTPPDVAGRVDAINLARPSAAWLPGWARLAMAACLLIGVGAWAALWSPGRNDREIATAEATVKDTTKSASTSHLQDDVNWNESLDMQSGQPMDAKAARQVAEDPRPARRGDLNGDGVMPTPEAELARKPYTFSIGGKQAETASGKGGGEGDRGGDGRGGAGKDASGSAASSGLGPASRMPSRSYRQSRDRNQAARREIVKEEAYSKAVSERITDGNPDFAPAAKAPATAALLPAPAPARGDRPLAPPAEEAKAIAAEPFDDLAAIHPADPQGREQFAKFHDNRFLTVADQPLSTFSIDVDTAAYSIIRNKLLTEIALPPPESVRIEELINYFPYDYAQPAEGAPFAVHVDIAACPWQTKHRLVRIGLKGREIPNDKRPPTNLVFLVDVSGSMQSPNKLPLVQAGLLRLVDQLDERDRVAIVVYAGHSGCVLESTVCTDENKTEIKDAVRALSSGGSTNGEAGIQQAYQIAKDHFVEKGANRVILCTDGDWNVGTTDTESLKKLVADRAKNGVFLSALGFGMGNLNDHMLEQIADNGNGVYGYIDDESEIEKLFVKQLSGTLVTIAKDVKIQVEFNPAAVAGYRLIGYENRVLAKEDFNDDKKDAGDIGAGHTVTALYEVVPAGEKVELPAELKDAAGSVDELEFQQPKKKEELEPTEKAKTSGDMLLVKLRYKAPDGDTSTLIKQPAKDGGATFAAASTDFRFAASVAAFGMILRNSPYKGDITLAAVEEIAKTSVGDDVDRHRREFVDLIGRARRMLEKPVEKPAVEAPPAPAPGVPAGGPADGGPER